MNNKMDKILAEISAGELIDKITILEIKKEKISDKDKLSEVQKELNSLSDTMEKCIPDQRKVIKFKDELKIVNEKLWDVENGKRLAEKKQDFGEKFVKLSRDVHFFNDDRAKIKLEINNITGSKIREIKEYTSY